MRILIDADGCPVVDIAVKVAKRKNIECIILCDTSHAINKEGVQTITVDKGNDSVDFVLVNLVKPKDIVITQDYGLAAMCLAMRALPMNQDGLVYTDHNIEQLLFSRHIGQKVRMAGGRTKGPSKRTHKQDADFEVVLINLIENEERG